MTRWWSSWCPLMCWSCRWRRFASFPARLALWSWSPYYSCCPRRLLLSAYGIPHSESRPKQAGVIIPRWRDFKRQRPLRALVFRLQRLGCATRFEDKNEYHTGDKADHVLEVADAAVRTRLGANEIDLQ